MREWSRLALLLMLSAVPTSACMSSPFHPDAPSPKGNEAAAEGASSANQDAVWVAAHFPTLDAYLAHLKRESYIGGKWYREIKPGLYELDLGNLHLDKAANEKRIFTREELERKFGFRH